MFRLVFKIMDKKNIDCDVLKTLKQTISKSSPSIGLVLRIYREPSFIFFVDYLRETLTEQRLPEVILAMPLKPAPRITMLQVA